MMVVKLSTNMRREYKHCTWGEVGRIWERINKFLLTGHFILFELEQLISTLTVQAHFAVLLAIDLANSTFNNWPLSTGLKYNYVSVRVWENANQWSVSACYCHCHQRQRVQTELQTQTPSTSVSCLTSDTRGPRALDPALATTTGFWIFKFLARGREEWVAWAGTGLCQLETH